MFSVVEGNGTDAHRRRDLRVGAARHLRRALVVPGVAPGGSGGGGLQLLRPSGAAGAGPVARRGAAAHLNTTEQREGMNDRRPLPNRPDRPELEHDDGDGDSGDVPRARGGGAGAVHVSLEPHADEEGDAGGARGDGRRIADRCAAELADARVDVMGYACLVAIMCMGKGYHCQSEGRLHEVTVREGSPTPS